MKFTLKELDTHQVELITEVDVQQFEQYKSISARKISKESKISGFRPGKAPYDIVKRIYGKDFIEERAVKELINVVYKEAIEKSKIKPSWRGE